MNAHNQPKLCGVCGRPTPADELMPFDVVRTQISEILRRTRPEWGEGGLVCLEDLHQARSTYVAEMLEQERGEMTALEQEVVRSLREQELLSQNVNLEFDRQLTFGERVADHVATFGGSWRFIIIFGAVLVFWIVLNTINLLQKPFDPFPYILLNLVLSCLAAIQAPVIMMSQNRQESKDRLRGEHDYRVNLKAELEIRQLHAKLDQLLTRQWQRLLEIQQVQMELMEEIASHRRSVEPEGLEGGPE